MLESKSWTSKIVKFFNQVLRPVRLEFHYSHISKVTVIPASMPELNKIIIILSTLRKIANLIVQVEIFVEISIVVTKIFFSHEEKSFVFFVAIIFLLF